MNYTSRPKHVQADRWFSNGDHPLDESIDITTASGDSFLSEGKLVRRYRRPDIPGGRLCRYCGHTMDQHGWIESPNSHTVCPGDYIVTSGDGVYYPVKPDVFEAAYEPMESK